MAILRKYPTDVQSFEKIIEGGFMYVDKTEYIYQLAATKFQCFLSRPRRFGKSLLISTMQAYFEGRKELFKGLAIERLEKDWISYPVIKFALNTVDPKTPFSLINAISSIFTRYEEQYGVSIREKELSDRFANILLAAYKSTGRKVVVLVDEYDGPLLSTLERPLLNESYRDTLKSIFSVLKSYDEYIKFAFVTGVSRFSHTSLFSGANHLKDISFWEDYSAICGITEEELKTVFPSSIRELAAKLKTSEEETLRRLKENYDGYHFCQDSPDIYNPYSILNAFESKKIDNFWFDNATPTYLINIMKRDDFFLPELDCLEAVQYDLSVKESYLNNPVALLFESGYVTIKDYDEEKGKYLLGLPNQEVAESFSKALMPIYSGYKESDCNRTFLDMRDAIIDGEAELFMNMLKTFLSGNPYGNSIIAERESYFKNNLYIILRALGFKPRAEEQTCWSRMDVQLETRRFIYIFELKTNGSVAKAMPQIEEKEYAAPYQFSKKEIVRIAANYSTQKNNIDTWIIE